MQNIGKALVVQGLAFYLWRMKYQLLSVLLLLIGINMSVTGQYSRFNEFINKKNFHGLVASFRGKDFKKLPADARSVYWGIWVNARGDAGRANEILQGITDPNSLANDSLKYFYYKTLYDGYVQLFNYARAAETGRYLVEHFPSFFKNDDLQAEKDALVIWEAFRQTPAQTLTRPDSVKITMKKDVAGLWTVPVTVGSDTYSFIFDSGAGLSTISESYAKLLGLTIMEGATVPIAAGITGIPTQSKLGVAPELHIKNIVVKNCIFLVFPDSSLSFANGAYKINGIIGFPVIREMQELNFTGDELLVRNTSQFKVHPENLAVDQLKPVAYMGFKDKKYDLLPFTLDFGASQTIFSDVFYKRYKNKLDKEGTPAKQRFAGASGAKEFDIVKMPVVRLYNEGKAVSIKEASVSKEVLHLNEDVYYGNIGQDVLKQFKRIVINFKDGYFFFR